MKAKDALRITGITRTHLSRLVKQGKIKITKRPNGRYIYDVEDVYNYVGKKRCNLKVIYARVSTSKQKADLTRQIEILESFVLTQGLKIDQFFSDIASGINFEKRKQFFSLLDLVLDGQVEKVFISYFRV